MRSYAKTVKRIVKSIVATNPVKYIKKLISTNERLVEHPLYFRTNLGPIVFLYFWTNLGPKSVELFMYAPIVTKLSFLM